MMRWVFVVVLHCAAGSAFADGAFTYDSFAARLRATGARSVEAALAEIPDAHWSRYTLFHTSRSLQQATPDTPRVILFGEDASFVIAYGGDPKLAGADTLEMIQWRDDSRTFEFRQIRFPTERNRLTEPRFSEANPASCRVCHRPRPRPNWDHYSTWTGAYGSDDDTLGTERNGRAEREQYLNFLSKNGGAERYRRLVRDARPISPYSEERFGKPSRRPNLLLTQLFSRRNAQRIAHAVVQADDAKLSATREILGCARNLGAETPLLAKLGIPRLEWTLAFIAPNEKPPLYGSYFEGFYSMESLVQYALYRELAAKYPSVEAKGSALVYPYLTGNYPREDEDYVRVLPRLGGVLANGTSAICEELGKIVSPGSMPRD